MVECDTCLATGRIHGPGKWPLSDGTRDSEIEAVTESARTPIPPRQ